MITAAKLQVKNIRKGINPASASLIYFTGPYLATGFKIGVVAGMIGLTVRQTL
jgi:sulfate transporter 1, high-affinity